MGFLVFIFRVAVLVGVFLLARRLWRIWQTKKQAAISKVPQAQDLQKCPACETYVSATSPACARPACPRRAMGLVFLMVGLITFGGGAMAAEQSSGRYVLTVSGASEVTASVLVNGIMTNVWQLSPKGVAGTSLNHWLRQGKNRVQVRLAGAGASKATGDLVFLGIDDKGNQQKQTLLKLAGGRSDYSIQFQISRAPLLNLWLDRPAQPFLKTDEGAVLAEVALLRSQLTEALKQGQDSPLANALTPESEDFALAYGGVSLDGRRQSWQGGATAEAGGIVAASAPPVAGEVVFEALESGALVRVARRDGKALVVIKSGDREFLAPSLIYGRMKNGWQLLRRAG